MKKILKIILLSLLGLILLVLIGLHIAYHTFSPDDKGVEVVKENLVYFQESYEECRNSFLSEARNLVERYDQSELFSIEVPSKTNKGLFIDVLYIPPTQDSSNLLVLSSGVHGVEGLAGSAVQKMFMNELLSDQVLEEMGVLILHAINPYGLLHGRRQTENNIDLNRGSDMDPILFQSENPGYAKLTTMLGPHGEASQSSLRNQFFYMVAISKMLKESMSVLRQAVLLGQYKYPKGIYYGGTDFEPQIDSLQRILPAIFAPFETILTIDLHTGYGSRGILHLFPNPVEDPVIKRKTEEVFGGNPIDWGDSEDFYTINGAFADVFLRKVNPEATYLYMVFEWGTFDSEKTFGSLKSLQRIINENQGFNYGYKNQKQEEKIKRMNRELYFASSDAWRSVVMESGREMLTTALENFPQVN